jgi:hypothetical protein
MVKSFLDEPRFRSLMQAMIEIIDHQWCEGERYPIEFIGRKDDMVEGHNVAALFQAPERPEGLDAAQHADPLQQQDDVERELSRLRNCTVDAIVREYLGTRDHLDEKRHEYQDIERDLKGRLTMMSMVLREKADNIGVDAFPIRGLGTAYRSVKVSVRVADWDSYWKWLVETGNSQCVEKRAAKLAVLEVTRAQGQLPPGLDKVEEVEFLVRRNDA